MGWWRVGRAGWIEDKTLAVLCALVAAVGVLARLVRHGGDTGVVAGDCDTGFAMCLRWGAHASAVGSIHIFHWLLTGNLAE